MILRHQLPVWSPLTLSALLGGLLPRTGSLRNIENRVRSEYGGSSVRLTASGTVALALAFRASAPSTARPRIALPAWGCYDLMTAADAVDAEVVLYDLDPHRLAPDGASFDAALGMGPHAVVVAHWFGIPIDLRAIRAETTRRGILLIDDAAQAVGSSVGGTIAGAMGDLGILSFGRGKGRTGGSGGALVGSTPRGAEALDRLPYLEVSGSGWGPYASLWAQWVFGRPVLYGVPSSLPFLRLGQTIYRSPPDLGGLPPRNAQVLERGWGRSGREVEVRRTRAERWQTRLREHGGLRLIELDRDARPGWLRFPVLASSERLEGLTTKRAAAVGIARGYPRTLSDLPVHSGRILKFSRGFRGADELARTLITFPTHSLIAERDFSAVDTLHL